jgi:AraC-like DNA-binding protein
MHFAQNNKGRYIMEQPENPIQISSYDETVNYMNVLNFENGVCDAIAAGNVSLLDARMAAAQISPFKTSVRGESVQWDKYSFIALISQILRAAIHGGLPHFVAFSLSASYCSKVDKATTTEEIKALTRQMLYDYCNQVSASKVGTTSSHVIRRCQAYIHEHLHDNISMEDLAEYCRVSTRSISAHFKKELNVSVPAYITNEKLSEAKYLLSYSNYTISEISNYLSFSSQSYFTKVFKTAFGCTPQQYRDGKIPS